MIEISSIKTGERFRELDEGKVKELMVSIGQYGQVSPIALNKGCLVYGAHRLEACKRLGHTHIKATTIGDCNNPTGLKIIEIIENLHRTNFNSKDVAIWSAELVRLKQLELTTPSVGDISETLIMANVAKNTKTEVSKLLEQSGINATTARKAVSDGIAVQGLDADKVDSLNVGEFREVAAIAKKDKEQAGKRLDVLAKNKERVNQKLDKLLQKLATANKRESIKDLFVVLEMIGNPESLVDEAVSLSERFDALSMKVKKRMLAKWQ